MYWLVIGLGKGWGSIVGCWCWGQRSLVSLTLIVMVPPHTQIDLQTFLTLTDQDLKELGITTFGARRKMLLAISGVCMWMCEWVNLHVCTCVFIWVYREICWGGLCELWVGVIIYGWFNGPIRIFSWPCVSYQTFPYNPFPSSYFPELNKNRRKLFDPPNIRSSFLEGGASGRLPRQFHADMASVSGRWWDPLCLGCVQGTATSPVTHLPFLCHLSGDHLSLSGTMYASLAFVGSFVHFGKSLMCQKRSWREKQGFHVLMPLLRCCIYDQMKDTVTAINERYCHCAEHRREQKNAT